MWLPDQVLRRDLEQSYLPSFNPARRATNRLCPASTDGRGGNPRSGARAVLVGSCAPLRLVGPPSSTGVAELESGSIRLPAIPTMMPPYGRGVYAKRLVRYYEDSTLATALANPDPSTGQLRSYPAEGAGDDRLRGQSVRLLPKTHVTSVVRAGHRTNRVPVPRCVLQGAGWPLGRRDRAVTHGACRDAAVKRCRHPWFAGCLSLHKPPARISPRPDGESNACLHVVAGPPGLHVTLPLP